jgi:hypothetical protein
MIEDVMDAEQARARLTAAEDDRLTHEQLLAELARLRAGRPE